MALFQWQKVDPTPDEIDAALVEAYRASGYPQPPTSARLTVAIPTERSGSRAWGGSLQSATWVVWWTDHLGRRHWYVEGDQYPPHAEPNPMWRCRGDSVARPLEVIDPLHTAVRGMAQESDVLVVCDCGEVGSPESLGWTGDCCGPCFDRRAEEAGHPDRLAFHPHRTSVTALDFTEDGRILSLGEDGAVHLHDPRTGVGTLLAPSSNLGGAWAVVLPGNSVVVAFSRSEVACWAIDSGEELWRTHCRGELMGIAASPDGDRLAVDAVSEAYLLDLETGEGESMSEDLAHFAFGPDGTLFAFDYGVRAIVSRAALTETWNQTGLEFGEEDDCYSLDCSPTGSLLAAGGNGGRVQIGDLATSRWLHTIECPAGIVCNLDFAPDGRTLASAHDGIVLFQDAKAGSEKGRLTLPAGASVSSLAFSSDGDTLAVGDDHGVVRLWPWRRMLEWAR